MLVVDIPSIEEDSAEDGKDAFDASFIKGWAGIFFLCHLGLGSKNNLAVVLW